MGEKYAFCFEGGETKQPPIQKSFLFGIVGGKELPLYKIIKMGYADKIDKIKPQTTFGLPESSEGIAMQSAKETYISNVKHWKLFSSVSAFGVQKRVYSVYLKMEHGENTPVSQIHPVIRTESFLNSLLHNMYSTSTCFACSHTFIGRFKLINRHELPSILGEDALKWSKRMSPPPISLLKEMIYIDRRSVRRTGRMIRLQK